MRFSKLSTIVLGLGLLFVPFFVSADSGNQQTSFFIDPTYDLTDRAQLTATLVRITPTLYLYLDNTWWNSLDFTGQSKIKSALQDLGYEFENVIYPQLTATFGSEWTPGIDNDKHITVLFHPMKEGTGGYTNTADEYSRLQNIFSNERELIYLNSNFLITDLAKSYLAHEFMHLITFNQKEKRLAKAEETWLNEARADYTPTLLGYDANYQNSNLRKRVQTFLVAPTDSLTEWRKKDADYGVLNLFTMYLVENYGVGILTNSLASEKTGIASINEALLNNGFSQTFSDVFTDFTIAVALNNCQESELYCFKNSNLINLKVIPKISFLPFSSESVLAQTQEVTDWQGQWYKVIGGGRDLRLEFAGYPDVDFKVPYILEYKNGEKQVNFLELNSFQSGRIVLENFGEDIVSVIIAPSIQDKMSGFGKNEKTYPFFWSVSSENNAQVDGESQTEEVQVLTQKISFLEKQLDALKARLRLILTGETDTPVTGALANNLAQGDRGEQVTLLQTWLAQDPAIYPEALVTGYFGKLTTAAVIRFQNKYQTEILAPWNLTTGNGFVGSTTRKKLNELYGD